MSVMLDERSRAEAFARQLRVLRQVKGVHQSDLAEQLGVDPSTISHWENAKRQRPPTADMVARLEEVLEAPPGFLSEAAGYAAPVREADPEAETGEGLDEVLSDTLLTDEDVELLADIAALLRRRRERRRRAEDDVLRTLGRNQHRDLR